MVRAAADGVHRGGRGCPRYAQVPWVLFPIVFLLLFHCSFCPRAAVHRVPLRRFRQEIQSVPASDPFPAEMSPLYFHCYLQWLAALHIKLEASGMFATKNTEIYRTADRSAPLPAAPRPATGFVRLGDHRRKCQISNDLQARTSLRRALSRRLGGACGPERTDGRGRREWHRINSFRCHSTPERR